MLITSGVARAVCPVCGQPHTACGPRTSTTPVDERLEPEVTTVGERRKYKVRLNGNDTVLNLSEEELKLYPDAEPVDAPQRKTRTAQADKARRGVENK